MKKGSRLFTAIIVVIMVLLSCLPAFAEVRNRVIYIPPNQVWTTGIYSDTHNPDYSYVGARCHSVYPPDGGVEFYKKIHCTVENAQGVRVSDSVSVLLNETDTDYTAIELRQGYLTVTRVYFKFRGNSSVDAEAVVSYTGTLK